MYERAINIARLLKESENENQALNLGRRKMEVHRGGFRGGNYKQYRPSYKQGKGKQPMA